MKGKNKCKILKDIRKAIAKENNIEYVTSECKYQGDCSGTCPKCEAEVRYLEAELEKRRASGKSIALAGIAASMILSSGCGSSGNGIFTEKTMGDMAPLESEQNSSEAEYQGGIGISASVELIDGKIPYPNGSSEEEIQTTGQIIYPDSSEELSSEEFIEGEVPFDPEEITGEVPDVTLEIMGDMPPPDFSEAYSDDSESEIKK